MILSSKQRELLNEMLESRKAGASLTEEEQGIWNDIAPMCPSSMLVLDFLKEVARTGRTDSLNPAQILQQGNPGAFAPQEYPSQMVPISASTQKQFDQIAAQNAASAGSGDASGMREVQARIRQIIKAEPSSGIYMLMLKCYDDPVCKRWYKTSPWLMRIQITNAIRTIIDAEEADVLAFISGAPVAPSDF